MEIKFVTFVVKGKCELVHYLLDLLWFYLPLFDHMYKKYTSFFKVDPPFAQLLSTFFLQIET